MTEQTTEEALTLNDVEHRFVTWTGLAMVARKGCYVFPRHDCVFADGKLTPLGAYLRMATVVQCNCGAEYRRSEEKFLLPHTGDAICVVCGAALESWLETTHVPKYELVECPARNSHDNR
jgi:hypothetical protein